MLQVIDSGAGIPAADLPRIFDRFWRGPPGGPDLRQRDRLAIAAELTRAHGGRLTVSSQPGQGTQLTRTLPAAT